MEDCSAVLMALVAPGPPRASATALPQEETRQATADCIDLSLPPFTPHPPPAASPPAAIAHSSFDEEEEVGDEDLSEDEDELMQAPAESAAAAIVVADDALIPSDLDGGGGGLPGAVGRGCFCADTARLNHDILCSHHNQPGSRCYATHIHCLKRVAGKRYSSFVLGTSCFLCRACVTLPQFTPPDPRFFECVVDSDYGHVYNPVHRPAASAVPSEAAALEAALKDSIRESMRLAANVASASASVSALAGAPVSSAAVGELREFTPSELRSIHKSAALKLLAGSGASTRTLAEVQAVLQEHTSDVTLLPARFGSISSSSSSSGLPRPSPSPSSLTRASSPERPLSPALWLYFYPVAGVTTRRNVRVCLGGAVVTRTKSVKIPLTMCGRGRRKKVPVGRLLTHKDDAPTEGATPATAAQPPSASKTSARSSKKRPTLEREASPEKKRRALHSVTDATDSSSDLPPPPLQRSSGACWCRCNCAPCRTLHADAEGSRHHHIAPLTKNGSVSDFTSALCGSGSSSASSASAKASSFVLSSQLLLLPGVLLDPLRRLLEPAALSMDELRRMPQGLVRQVILAAVHDLSRLDQLTLPMDVETLVRRFSDARFELAFSTKPAHPAAASSSAAATRTRIDIDIE